MPNDHFEQLIEQLKPVANDPEFDKIFRSLTDDEDGPTRFQLKMELRRLASPCSQTLDLRNRVTGHCEPYEFLGRRHYLDDVARDIFERGLIIYNGVFTQDTYEQILSADNNNRVIQEKEREQALKRKEEHVERIATREELSNDSANPAPYLVDIFNFGQHLYRAEERMNFSVEVALARPNQSSIKALTSDISITGLRIRVDQAFDAKIGESLNIFFTGLAKEFTLDANKPVPYSVVSVDRQGQRTYLSLNRDSSFQSDTLDAFLNRFISGYKRRYRVNVDNTYQTMLNEGHKQFLMPRLGHLPLYFSVKDKQLHADFVLSTENNRHIVEDWINEHNQLAIGSIFNARRSQYFIKALAKQPTQTTTLLTFNISARGKIHYYSAIAEELIKNDYWDTFVNFAARKDSFRAYQFRLSELDISTAWQPQSVPLSVDIPYRRNPPTQMVKQALAPLSYIGTLTDITDTMRHFAGTDYDADKVRSLKVFLHPPAIPVRTKDVRLEFVNLRKEQRYTYRSRCRVRVGKSIREGMLLDLSVNGLKVQLDDAIEFSEPVAHVSLNGFEKQFKKHALQELPYTIVNTDAGKTTLNLTVPDGTDEHAGAAFFKFFIREHRNQLKLLHENNAINGIELCLRNLYCNAPPTVPLFLYQNTKRQTDLRRAGLSAWPTAWHQLLNGLPGSSNHNLNLQPVFRGGGVTTELIPELQDMTRADRPVRKLLLIKLYREQNEALLQTEWQDVETLDKTFIEAFIDQCLPSASFMAIQVELSRTGRPDIQFVQAEMNYLAQYASHRANELEEELWQVFGIADTIDVTDDILKFAEVDLPHRQEQKQRLRQWLAHY